MSPTNASVIFDSHSSLAAAANGMLDDAARPAVLREAVQPRAIFSLGGDSAGLGFHTHGPTLLALLHGFKFWMMAPHRAKLPRAWLDPVRAHGRRLVEIVSNASDAERARAGLLKCLQPPGTALFLPSHWWHATVNVGDAAALALQGPPGIHELQEATASDATVAFEGADRSGTEGAEPSQAAHAGDLRPLFAVAESLATAGYVEKAAAQMQAARERVRAVVADHDEPMPHLASALLIRIGFTLCYPLGRVDEGASAIAEALQHHERALQHHAYAEQLRQCVACAADDECEHL